TPGPVGLWPARAGKSASMRTLHRSAWYSRAVNTRFTLCCSVVLLAAGLLGAPQARADEPTKKQVKERCALFDQIWQELSTHDAFFDPDAAESKKLRDEYRKRVSQIDDPNERLREIVRLISRLGDGHTHITTRWFLPDKPPPPLPLAGKEPLFRPALRYQKF